MAAAKRNQAQREQDLVFIEKLFVQGQSQRTIAAELSKARSYTLSHKSVCRDIEEILKRWRETILADVGKLKAAELARLNKIEQEAWDAWHESRRHKEKTVSERKTGDRPAERAQVTREKLNGDPRYLQIVQSCIKQRCDILGLNAPTEVRGNLTLAEIVLAAREKEHAADGA